MHSRIVYFYKIFLIIFSTIILLSGAKILEKSQYIFNWKIADGFSIYFPAIVLVIIANRPPVRVNPFDRLLTRGLLINISLEPLRTCARGRMTTARKFNCFVCNNGRNKSGNSRLLRSRRLAAATRRPWLNLRHYEHNVGRGWGQEGTDRTGKLPGS